MAAGETMQQQLVFHRPIGVTQLGEEEWVCSLQQNIPLLLMRQDDPGAKARQERVSNELYRLAVESVRASGQNIRLTNGEVYVNELHRASLLKQAKLLAKASGEGETTPNGPPPYFRFLAPTEQKVEMKFIFALRDPELIAQAEGAIPLTGFETRGGASADEPQEPVPYLKGLSKVQAFDAMSRRIHATIYGGGDDHYQDMPPEEQPQGIPTGDHKEVLARLPNVDRGLAPQGASISDEMLSEWSILSGIKPDQKVVKPLSLVPTPVSSKEQKEVPPLQQTERPSEGGGVEEKKVNLSPTTPTGQVQSQTPDPVIAKHLAKSDKRSNSSGGSNPSKNRRKG
jgi:hypothetical protein